MIIAATILTSGKAVGPAGIPGGYVPARTTRPHAQILAALWVVQKSQARRVGRIEDSPMGDTLRHDRLAVLDSLRNDDCLQFIKMP